MRRFSAALAASVLLCGCAHNAPRAVAPASAPIAAPTRPADDAFLTLDHIKPRPVLADLARPATAPATRPSLDAVEFYARARGAKIDNNRNSEVNLLERAIAADPSSFDLRYALGQAYASMTNRSEEAIKAYESAAKIDPNRLELQVELGRQYLARQDATKALTHLRLALQTSDYSTDDELAALADFYLARALQQKGYDRAALDQYDRLLKRLARPSLAIRSSRELAFFASRPDILWADVGALYEKHGQLDQALRAFQFVSQRNPDDLEIRTSIVNILLALHRNDEAIAQAEQAVERLRANPDSLALLRSVYKKLGREGAIVDELTRLHKQKPDDRAILFALADTLDAQGRTSEADALLSQAVARRPQAVDIIKRQFALHDARDETQAAARILLEYLAQQPDAETELLPQWNSLFRNSRKNSLRLNALQNLAVAPSAQACKLYWIARLAPIWNRDALARSSLEQAVKHSPPYAPAYRTQLAQIFGRNDLTDSEKRTAADELIERARSQGAAALAEELRGSMLTATGKPADADKAFAEAMRLGDSSPDMRLAYAQALRAGGQSQKFEQILWKLISDRPGFEAAYEALLQYYLASNSSGQAQKVLDTWQAADPQSIQARLFQVTILFQRGQIDPALAIMLDLFRDNPEDATVLGSMRALYSASDRLPQLVEKLEDERAKHPDNRSAVELLVQIYVTQKRLPEATRVLDSARLAVGSDPDLLYYISHLYELVDQKGTTEQILEEVVRIDPRHAAANNDLGYTWADEGKNLPRAEQMIRAAIQQEPDNGAFLDSLGWVLYKRGKFLEARKYFEQAVAPASLPDPVMLDHLGDTLYRLDNTTAAAENWQRATERVDALAKAGLTREDLATLKLSLQQKLKQIEQKQPVTVAPIASATTTPDHSRN